MKFAEPRNLTSRMVLDQTTRNAIDIDENTSETSEGSSIDFDAPPGRNKTIPRTHHSQNGPLNGSEADLKRPVLQTHPHQANQHVLARLGSDSFIPTPLKDIINQWLSAKGDSYSLDDLPCLTTRDQKYVSQSTKGRLATWETRDGKPLAANMYALKGVDLRQGQQKILVVEGTDEGLGPFIVSYTNEGSTGDRVAFKKWVGLGGDKKGFEKGYSVVKKFPVQTHLSTTKRGRNLSPGDTEVLTTALENNPPKSHKRKRLSDPGDDSSLLEIHSHSGIYMTTSGEQPSAALTSRPMNKEFSPTERLSTPSQPAPVVNIPSRRASSKDDTLRTLKSPSPESFAEPNIETIGPVPRPPSQRSSRSQVVAKPGISTNVTLDESPMEPISLAAKVKSPVAYNSLQRKVTQETAPLGYSRMLMPVHEAAHRDANADMQPILAPGYTPVQKSASSHSPLSPRDTNLLAEESFVGEFISGIGKRSPFSPPQARPESDQTRTLITTSQSPGDTQSINQLTTRRSSIQKLMPAEPITNEGMNVIEMTTARVATSTTAESPHRTEARIKHFYGGTEGNTSAVTKNTIPSSPHVQKPGETKEASTLPPSLLKRNLTEDTPNTAGLARMPAKLRKKLRLQHVFFKFNSALRHEPPRVRPFTACDTVQKLFHQARTGDVFGKASEVRSGGKLLTVEFRGSGRLYDEVYLINEDDEEDFVNMKTALLKKDWWTEVDDTIVGGGLLDVRDAK
jgi:hypothetical protein